MVLVKLDEPPMPQYAEYLQSDYVEILCLTHPDGIVSQSEVLDRFKEDADLNDLSEFDNISDEPAQKVDENINRIESWFKNISFRSHSFGDAYPFELSSSGKTLNLKPSLTSQQKLYIYLLIASHLRYISKSNQIHIANSFELVSVEALKRYFHYKADVYLFGSNPLNNGIFRGNIFNKIKLLAENLFEPLKVTDSDFSSRSTGDEGLDIVAWLPIGDSTAGFIIVFGQCACTLEWETKQASSDFEKWRKIIDLSVRPINTIFIPFCFRDTRGLWYEPHKITTAIMMDRLRLMKLLAQESNPLSFLPNNVVTILEQILAYKVSIV